MTQPSHPDPIPWLTGKPGPVEALDEGQGRKVPETRKAEAPKPPFSTNTETAILGSSAGAYAMNQA